MSKRCAATLLLLAALAMPQLLGLGGHALAHPEPAVWSDLAKTLVHGHEHEEGVPEHEHRFLPFPPLRPEAPQEVQAPAIAPLEALAVGPLRLATAQPGWLETQLSGSSPPRLHLLCALLI